MRWAGVSVFALAVATAGCAGRKTTVVSTANVSSPEVTGIWDGVVRATISEGMGDRRHAHREAGVAPRTVRRRRSPATTSQR